jgi:hypothetical protein
MSVKQRARDLSRRLSSTFSDISFPIVYRESRGQTITPTSGTITNIFNDIYMRAYQQDISMKEMALNPGVIERGDIFFRVTEDKLTPRSEEDRIYKGVYYWGEVAINSSATKVVGSSVNWEIVEPGDYIRFSSQATFHRVASVVNANSQINISESYSGANLSSATYCIYRDYQVIGWEGNMSRAEWKIQGRGI